MTRISGPMTLPSSDHTELADREMLASSSEFGPGDDCDDEYGCGDDVGQR